MRNAADFAEESKFQSSNMTSPNNNMKPSSMENSLLTEEEQEALKPKEVKVENPWIYEQTHQEYLDNIKVANSSYFAVVLVAALLAFIFLKGVFL